MNTIKNEHNIAENEGKIILQALGILKKIAKLEYAIEPAQDLPDQGYDYFVKGKVFGIDFTWYVEVKKCLTKAGELQALLNKEKLEHPFLLATEYVNPEAATRLHEAGIQFIDTVGNAFVNHPPLFIFVKGNKPVRKENIITTARVFKGVGLKILFALLRRPALVEMPYRYLAEMTSVALGTVQNTMTELIQKGFILDMGIKGKKLLNKEKLFERWTEAYPENLKPKLLMGRFRGEENWWKDIQLDPAFAQWGGEAAAAKLTGYLKPETITLYANKNRLADIVLENKLKKDPQGNVEILERFWQVENGLDEDETVHPFIVYADLIAIGDQRTMETARMIYEQHIEGYFRQD